MSHNVLFTVSAGKIGVYTRDIGQTEHDDAHVSTTRIIGADPFVNFCEVSGEKKKSLRLVSFSFT